MWKIIFIVMLLVSCSSEDRSEDLRPLAVEDQVYGFRSETATWDLKANDQYADAAVIQSLKVEGTIGEVRLNENGSVSYFPLEGFTGNDFFTYELCSNNETKDCSTARVEITVVEALNLHIPEALQNYYSNFKLSTNAEFNDILLSNLVREKHSVILSYGQRHNFLYEADEDPGNPENVILMYSGESRYWREFQSGNNSYNPQTFNTEHVYPQSLLGSSDAVTDLHHLRVADIQVNSIRSNYPFTEVSGESQLVNNSWYPGDEWRGDVARMIFYLNLRYNEKFEKVGDLELFLKWNRLDPVSNFELHRNLIIQQAQGNRNPFIDNPYLATLIWGGSAAENYWE